MSRAGWGGYAAPARKLLILRAKRRAA